MFLLWQPLYERTCAGFKRTRSRRPAMQGRIGSQSRCHSRGLPMPQGVADATGEDRRCHRRGSPAATAVALRAGS